MKKLVLVLAMLAVASIVAACSGDDDNAPSTAAGAAMGNFKFLGFSDHAGADNHAPSDVVRPGGTLRACNPAHLYAFVSFTGLQPPKEFVGTWTLNGVFLSRRVFTQTLASAETFWEVQNTPTSLSAGTYNLQLTIDGSVASQGSFTLTC